MKSHITSLSASEMGTRRWEAHWGNLNDEQDRH